MITAAMVMAFQEGYDAKWQSGEKCMVTCFGEGIKAIEKKFNIWIKKYANYIGAAYTEGHTNGDRWFMVEYDLPF